MDDLVELKEMKQQNKNENSYSSIEIQSDQEERLSTNNSTISIYKENRSLIKKGKFSKLKKRKEIIKLLITLTISLLQSFYLIIIRSQLTHNQSSSPPNWMSLLFSIEMVMFSIHLSIQYIHDLFSKRQQRIFTKHETYLIILRALFNCLSFNDPLDILLPVLLLSHWLSSSHTVYHLTSHIPFSSILIIFSQSLLLIYYYSLPLLPLLSLLSLLSLLFLLCLQPFHLYTQYLNRQSSSPTQHLLDHELLNVQFISTSFTTCLYSLHHHHYNPHPYLPTYSLTQFTYILCLSVPLLVLQFQPKLVHLSHLDSLLNHSSLLLFIYQLSSYFYLLPFNLSYLVLLVYLLVSLIPLHALPQSQASHNRIQRQSFTRLLLIIYLLSHSSLIYSYQCYLLPSQLSLFYSSCTYIFHSSSLSLSLSHLSTSLSLQGYKVLTQQDSLLIHSIHTITNNQHNTSNVHIIDHDYDLKQFMYSHPGYITVMHSRGDKDHNYRMFMAGLFNQNMKDHLIILFSGDQKNITDGQALYASRFNVTQIQVEMKNVHGLQVEQFVQRTLQPFCIESRKEQQVKESQLKDLALTFKNYFVFLN